MFLTIIVKTASLINFDGKNKECGFEGLPASLRRDSLE